MTRSYEVCGCYQGATPWITTVPEDEGPAALAERLARSAGCNHYTVDGEMFGPFPVERLDDSEPEEPVKSFCRNGCGEEIDDPIGRGPGDQRFFCALCNNFDQE